MLIVCGVAFAAARHAFASSPRQAFYQSEFGPAVMLALGHGFVDPVPAAGGPLESFLAQRIETLPRADAQWVQTREPDPFQSGHRYLMTAAGYWWRATSITWGRLADIAGFSHALAVASVFALIRLFTSLAPAIVGAAWFAVSPLQLGYAPHLRDFAKGAFVLAAIPLIVAMVTRPLPWRTLAATAALTGFVIGLGTGFKLDVAIMAPIAAASVILFRGSRPWSELRGKAAALAALVITLGLTLLPLQARTAGAGSNAAHVALLGFADAFDSRLGVEPATYGFLPFYSDEYLQDLLRVHAVRTTGVDAAMPSVEYDAAGFDMWRLWMINFPSDHYTRLLAAVNGVLNLAFDYPAPLVVDWVPTAWLRGFFDWMARWRGWGWALGFAILAAAASAGAGLALFAGALVVALTGYPSMQFDPRHYFHLQAIPIAAIVILLSSIIAKPTVARPVPWLRRIGIATIGFILIVMPIAMLRAYQRDHLRDVLSIAATLDRVPVDATFTSLDASKVLAAWTVTDEGRRPDGITAAYYVVEFQADAPRSAMAIGIRYREAPHWRPCALTQSLVTGAGVARFAFPVYVHSGQRAFDGLEMGAEMRQRLLGIYRVSRWPEVGPVMLRQPADWQQRRLTQRLTAEERFTADDVRVDATSARGPCGAEIAAIDATLRDDLAVAAGAITNARPGVVTVGPEGIVVDGDAEADDPVLVQFKPVTLGAGDAIVARVAIDRGGVVIGLMQEGTWRASVSTPRPGVSVVSVRAEQPGVYVPFIASGDPGWRAATRFTIDRFGVVAEASVP